MRNLKRRQAYPDIQRRRGRLHQLKPFRWSKTQKNQRQIIWRPGSPKMPSSGLRKELRSTRTCAWSCQMWDITWDRVDIGLEWFREIRLWLESKLMIDLMMIGNNTILEAMRIIGEVAPRIELKKIYFFNPDELFIETVI